MAEEWRPVIGYEGLYEVSDQGRLRGLDRVDGQGRRWPGRVFKIQYRPDGYASAVLSKEGSKEPRLVHRMVLESFVSTRPQGKEARHKNGRKVDCRLRNLEWSTHAENINDQIAHGTRKSGELNRQAKLTAEQVVQIRRRLASGEMQRIIAGAFGIRQATVSKIARRERWAHV